MTPTTGRSSSHDPPLEDLRPQRRGGGAQRSPWSAADARRNRPWWSRTRRSRESGRSQVSEELSGSPDHQGIVAEADPFPYVDAESLLDSEQSLVVALDQVQDPQNLGAICRTAETAGAAGACCRNDDRPR